MAEHVEDTDTLLALLSSLLDAPVTDHSVLLDALVQADGDVERAARTLNGRVVLEPRPKVSGVKRKRAAGLEGWLVKPSDASGSRASDHSPPSRAHAEKGQPPPSTNDATSSKERGSPVPERSPKKAKPVTQEEFMSILRPPNSADQTKQGPPKFPPLTLSTPALVAKHTPCTLHPSILPPELACR